MNKFIDTGTNFEGPFSNMTSLPKSERYAYNYIIQAQEVDKHIAGQMTRIWTIYRAISTRTAVLMGRFKGSIDYAMDIQKRANQQWQRKGHNRRNDRFKVFLSHVEENDFRKGW